MMQSPLLNRHSDTIVVYRPLMSSMGGRVKMLRKGAGLTQPRLAAISGVAQSTISDIENDLIPTPGAAVLSALCKALNTNMGWLMSGKGQSGPTDNAVGFDEVEALKLLRLLDNSHRQAWLTSGRTLLTHQTGKPSEHDPYSAPPSDIPTNHTPAPPKRRSTRRD